MTTAQTTRKTSTKFFLKSPRTQKVHVQAAQTVAAAMSQAYIQLMAKVKYSRGQQAVGRQPPHPVRPPHRLSDYLTAQETLSRAWNIYVQEACLVLESVTGLQNSASIERYARKIIAFIEREIAAGIVPLSAYLDALAPLYRAFCKAQKQFRQFVAQRRLLQRLFIVLKKVVAIVRFKTGHRHGSGVLTTRPTTIPLTVQPCAP